MAYYKRHGSNQQLILTLVLLTAVLLTAGDKFVLKSNSERDQLEEDVHGEQVVPVPKCMENEFLTSNGTHLVCTKLPDAGFCDCPDLVPMVGTGQPGTPVAPLPPPGCEVFSPPTRGAFACLRSPETIYCTVLCDHRFEFSSTPNNPYYCGEETGFNWRVFPNGLIQQSLPECTGFRHRLRLLHSHDNYLPAPCYGLSDHTIFIILDDLQNLLENRGCENCKVDDTFLQCPEVNPSARLYSQVSNVLDNYKK